MLAREDKCLISHTQLHKSVDAKVVKHEEYNTQRMTVQTMYLSELR